MELNKNQFGGDHDHPWVNIYQRGWKTQSPAVKYEAMYRKHVKPTDAATRIVNDEGLCRPQYQATTCPSCENK